MIRTEEHEQARLFCDGCDELTMLYPDTETARFEMPRIGWMDLGKGMTRCGRPFRDLCPICFKNWNNETT
jgi:hypothetical protein